MMSGKRFNSTQFSSDKTIADFNFRPSNSGVRRLLLIDYMRGVNATMIIK